MMSHAASAVLAVLSALLVLLALARERLASVAGRQRLVLAALALLAAGGLAAHLDFGRFHGDRGAVHYWDFFHYYMGAKYFDELGYTGLYDAAARADAEDGFIADGRAPVRSLADYSIGSRAQAAERGAGLAAAFSPERWAEFKSDLAVFRGSSPEAWRESAVLMDHGYNGTPLVSAVLGTVARQGLIDTAGFVRTMAFADLALAALAALLIGRWLGAAHGLAFLALFFLDPLNDYAMVGGSYLRHLHLLLLGLGAAAYHSDRKAIAGALLAGAGLLRLFPLLLVAGLVLQRALHRDRRALLRRDARFLAAFGLALAVLAAAASALYAGRASNPWIEHAAKISIHADKLTPNILGLDYPFLYSAEHNAAAVEASWPDGRRLNWIDEARRTLDARRVPHLLAGAALALLVLVAMWRSDGGAGWLAGLAAVYGAFHLSHYDWSVLCLVPLFLPGRRWALPGTAALFAALAVARLVPALDEVLDLRFCVASALVGLGLAGALATEIATPARGGRNGGP